MRYKFTPQIDPEFESLIPPLSDEEFAQLEANILEEGECHDPLLTWNKILLDGHNRWKIIQKHPGEIDYECTELIFNSRNEAMAWMIRNQLGRRNLSNYERARLALRLKEAIAAEAKENQGTRTDISQKSVESVDTQKELAKIAGVSHDTIHKVDVIERKAAPEIREQLRHGEVSINKAYNQVREPRPVVAPPKPIAETKIQEDPPKEMPCPVPKQPPTPTFTLEDLISEINGNADTFIGFVRNTLAARNGLYADADARKKVRDAIHKVLERLSEIENLIQ